MYSVQRAWQLGPLSLPPPEDTPARPLFHRMKIAVAGGGMQHARAVLEAAGATVLPVRTPCGVAWV